MNKIKEKYIYKITNNINQKIYIGQAKIPKDRWIAHCVPSSNNLIVDKAINKYGKENFSFEVIEGPIENYDEREQYWIEYYNCKIPNGYNILNGGSGGFAGLSGKDNGWAIYTNQQINNAINLLKTTSLSYNEIAKQTGIKTATTILNINLGKQWIDQQENYPLRTPKTAFINDQVPIIIELLKDKRMTQKEIERTTGIGHSLIDKINRGLAYRQENTVYPIRQSNEVGVKKQYLNKVNQAIDLLKNTNKPIAEIAKEVHLGLSTVYNINSGRQYNYLNDSYPIRKLS